MKTLPFAALLTAVLISSPFGATRPGSDRIMFLNLKLAGGQIQLVGTKVVDGTVKRPKHISYVENHFYFTVLSSSKQMLYEGTVPDPALLRAEYEDEEGRLQMKTVVRDNVEFSVRIPFYDAAHEVIFYKIDHVDHTGQSIEKRTRKASIIIGDGGEKHEE